MKLISKLAAKYRIDARLPDGRRLETDTLVDAEYSLLVDGVSILSLKLDAGLSINHDDNAGDGFLFVTLQNNQLEFIGKAQQRLTYTDCEGQTFGAVMRPEFIYIEG
jgi:hypothetical protein